MIFGKAIRICAATAVLLLLTVALPSGVDASRLPGKIEDANGEVESCLKNTPCGWAVYHRFSREIDYFMRNRCECPKHKKCIRTDDDISVNAYVYRCRDPDASKIQL
ncbi:PREDICTED: uncharacterized protein LOC108563929 [Nicrophorus vespilloides]|uniref:Uncharacterized protein LOC108563929 n=1 Tax=Nicrophorus vespilloides TaxID=110193 RepID=A0ABM1MUK5_NICVS|nr:PREDICTED: uncharacterized protein LOC108563929 [Nicrophorus vespilloides]